MRLLPFFIPFILIASSFAQPPTVDLSSLVGRRAVLQRMPFYLPGTYQPIPNTYAGQTVTIIAVKPSAMYAAIPKLTARQMASLPPESRANIENVRSASTLVVQFQDGTKADTGSIPVMPTTLPTYLDLIPDSVADANLPPAKPSSTPAVAAPVSPNEACPGVITKASSTNGGLAHALADGLTKSEFERAVEKANAGGNDPHYLDVRIRNGSNKSVRAIEAFVTYSDAMGDAGPQTTLLTQNTKDIKPGGEYRGYSVDTFQRSANGIGDVTVYVSRIRYEDNTFWLDNGSHSCNLTTRIK